MKPRERTMQQLDPLGSAGSRDSAVVITLATWTYVSLGTVIDFPNAQNLPFLVIALVLMSAACVVNLIASSPSHAPYSRAMFSLMLFLAIAGAAFQLAAVHGRDMSLANDWGPLSLALLLASASVFRPRRDQYFAGIFSVLSLGGILAIEAIQLEPTFGIAFFVVTGISPIVIIVMGQASYTGKATRTMVTWRRSFEDVPSGNEARGVVNSVGQQLSKEFRADVDPLLVGILQRDLITPADIESARIVAADVRQRLMELSHQSWLARTGTTVIDPNLLVASFDDSARTALTAFVQGLDRLGISEPTVWTSKNTKGGIDCELSSKITHDGLRLRSDLAPYLRVMYVVFDDVRVTYTKTEVRLKFHYGVE